MTEISGTGDLFSEPDAPASFSTDRSPEPTDAIAAFWPGEDMVFKGKPARSRAALSARHRKTLKLLFLERLTRFGGNISAVLSVFKIIKFVYVLYVHFVHWVRRKLGHVH
jgi:hypothetical protein